MRILIACEFSGMVRRAFEARGHYAVSCDILPAEDNPGLHENGLKKHVQGDVRDILDSPFPHWWEGKRESWDMMIAHPPCTYLANSGAKHLYAGMKKINGINPDRWTKMREAIQFFQTLQAAHIPRIVIENPIMLGHAQHYVGSPHQTIQPWQFGHGETKATCLWFRGGVSRLQPTNIVEGREARMWRMSPGPDRQRERSRTYAGIAQAMAEQWG